MEVGTAVSNMKPLNDYTNDLTPSFEIDPARTALIVVDMQNATGSRRAGLGRKLAQQGMIDQLAGERFERIENVVVPNLRRLLAFFRERGLRVIYITYGSEREDLADAPRHMRKLFRDTHNWAGQLEHEIVDEVKPLPGESVVNKTTVSAFTSTGIDNLLRNLGVEYLLFTGVSTNMCVGTTARDAADRGYCCVMVEDCCGAAKLDYHRWELVTFQRLFGRVDSSENLMAEINRNLAPPPEA